MEFISNVTTNTKAFPVMCSHMTGRTLGTTGSYNENKGSDTQKVYQAYYKEPCQQTWHNLKIKM